MYIRLQLIRVDLIQELQSEAFKYDLVRETKAVKSQKSPGPCYVRQSPSR